MKQIIVNVSGLTIEEKQRVNEALEKITGANKMSVISSVAAWFFAPASSGAMRVTWDYPSTPETPTHTPRQVLEMAEMAEMAKQGHVHAESMALYAEDAKTHSEPWRLWQVKDASGEWLDLVCNPNFATTNLGYRRKPKTHTVNGVEVPDLRFVPKEGEEYYLPYPLSVQLCFSAISAALTSDCHRASNNLCYEYTEVGKQAAILHAKAWLGIA